jgi:hypothetical protein
MKRLLAVMFVVFFAGASTAAAQGVCGGSCQQGCEWYGGGSGWKCAPGTAGCKCEYDLGYCMYQNCNESEEEEDEDLVLGSPVRAPSLALLAVSGDVYVALDACRRRPPLVLQLRNVVSIETTPWLVDGATRD